MLLSLTYMEDMGLEPIGQESCKDSALALSIPQLEGLKFISTPRGIRTLATSLRRRQRLCPLSYGSITLRTCFSIHVSSIAYKSRNSEHIAAPLTGVEPALLTRTA